MGRVSAIGVDIGATGVRAVQVRERGGVLEVIHAARCDRPSADEPSSNTESNRTPAGDGGPSDPVGPGSPAVSDSLARQAGWLGQQAASPGLSDNECEALAARIERCLRQTGFRGHRAVTALDAPAVEFHALELPDAVLAAAATDADKVIRWEIQRLVTDATETFEMRHWVLPSTAVSGPNAIGVAAPLEVITQTLTAFRRAGLRCDRVDTAANALCRLGSTLRPPGSEEVWGMLDVGARQTRLMLCVDEVPVLVRTVGSGGLTWTQRVAESLQISEQAAELHKRDHGIAFAVNRGLQPLRTADGDPQAQAGQLADAGADPARTEGHGLPLPSTIAPLAELGVMLLGCMRGDLTDLASEIKRSYEYVLSCYPRRGAADLILVGGGAVMRNLPEFLGHALGIPVRRVSDYAADGLGTAGPASGFPTRQRGGLRSPGDSLDRPRERAGPGEVRAGRSSLSMVSDRLGASWESFAVAVGLTIGRGLGKSPLAS